jgi:hypothetical protein
MAQSVQRQTTGWMVEESGFGSWQWQQIRLSVQTDSGAHPAPFKRGTEPSFSEGKAAGA